MSTRAKILNSRIRYHNRRIQHELDRKQNSTISESGPSLLHIYLTGVRSLFNIFGEIEPAVHEKDMRHFFD